MKLKYLLSVYFVNNDLKVYEQEFKKRLDAENFAEKYIYDYINKILEEANPDLIYCYQRVKEAESICEKYKLYYKIVQIKY
jgi:hypothetical protein